MQVPTYILGTFFVSMVFLHLLMQVQVPAGHTSARSHKILKRYLLSSSSLVFSFCMGLKGLFSVKRVIHMCHNLTQDKDIHTYTYSYSNLLNAEVFNVMKKRVNTATCIHSFKFFSHIKLLVIQSILSFAMSLKH